jgi:hypothetical protein
MFKYSAIPLPPSSVFGVFYFGFWLLAFSLAPLLRLWPARIAARRTFPLDIDLY